MSNINTEVNRLSVLGLVASDMSYWRNTPEGEALRPYLDSTPEADYFPCD